MSAAAMLFSMLLYFPDGIFGTCFGLKASAAEITLTEPSIDVNGVYQIGTSGELYWFANYVNSGNTNANAALTYSVSIRRFALVYIIIIKL